jgi:spermidine synthase
MMTLNKSNLIQQESDLKQILNRLKWLNDKPQGNILSLNEHYKNISLVKVGTEIHLIFYQDIYLELQSRIDLNDPLRLIAPYTQAMMLGLLWFEEPKNMHLVGLGGGRIPMILNHYFPEINVDITELDKTVVEVAEKYFAFEVNNNNKVFITDGRKFLKERKSANKYDIIMVDAFTGVGVWIDWPSNGGVLGNL